MAAKTASAPTAKAGDRIVIESQKVGQTPRRGTILSVTELPLGTSYEVRWDDGHQSGIRPAAGSAEVIRMNARP